MGSLSDNPPDERRSNLPQETYRFAPADFHCRDAADCDKGRFLGQPGPGSNSWRRAGVLGTQFVGRQRRRHDDW